MNKAIYYLSYKLTINGEVFTANSSCIYGTEYNQEYNLVKFDTFDNLWEFVRNAIIFRGIFADITLFRKRKVLRINDFSTITEKNFISATYKIKSVTYKINSMNELMRELNPKDFLEYCYDQLIMVKKEQDDVAQQN